MVGKGILWRFWARKVEGENVLRENRRRRESREARDRRRKRAWRSSFSLFARRSFWKFFPFYFQWDLIGILSQEVPSVLPESSRDTGSLAYGEGRWVRAAVAREVCGLCLWSVVCGLGPWVLDGVSRQSWD